MRKKTKVVSVRLSKQLYNVLKGITDELNKRSGNNIEDRYLVGDTIRLMIQYCSMQIILGRWSKPIRELREEFLDYLDSFSKRKRLKLIDEKT